MTETYGVPAANADDAIVDPMTVTADDDNLLDAFLADADGEIYGEVTFPISRRGKQPLFARFVSVVDYDDIKRYRKAARGTSKKDDEMDMTIANGMVLIEKNIGLFRGGTDPEHQVMAKGEPLTFGSRAFRTTYPDAPHAVAALRKFLGDAQLTTMGESLYKAAGYGADLEPVDPTDGSQNG